MDTGSNSCMYVPAYLLSFPKRKLPEHRNSTISSFKISFAKLFVISFLESVQRINLAGIVSISFNEPYLIPTEKTLIHYCIFMCSKYKLHSYTIMSFHEKFKKMFCQLRMQTALQLIDNKYSIRSFCKEHINQIKQSLCSI